jgi:hypothetical protein
VGRPSVELEAALPKEEAMEKDWPMNSRSPKFDKAKSELSSVCTMCGNPATCFVDGEPSCAGHIEQVYEHQVEDYTSRHPLDNEWRKV